MKSKDLDVFNQYESQVRSYCRRFPRIFNRSKGSLIFDREGNEYIDFLAGAGALNFGHNNSLIKEVVTEYMNNDGIIFSLDLHTEAKKDFILAMQEIILIPRELSYKIQFTSPTGTSVVESAIKLARKYTGRQNIVSFTNAFHGMTATSLSLTGSKGHRQSISVPGVTLLPFDGYLGENIDSIEYYRKLFSDPSSGVDLPAAIILETVQGEGGVNVASKQWLRDIRELTLELNILLIIDDIQAGVGRCGKFFSFEDANIKPDLVCISKSIGGIGLPLAVLLFSPELDVWSPSEDNGTFRGNNLAFVAATKMLEFYWSDTKFEESIADKEKIIKEFFSRVKSQHSSYIKQTRGRGLMNGIEFYDAIYASAIVKECFSSGLIIETAGPKDEVLKLMPALTIEVDLLNKALAIIHASINKVCSIAYVGLKELGELA